MTAPLPPKPVNLPAEPPLTRMSNELTSLRASVNKLARAQNALLFNVKARATKCGPCRARSSRWRAR